MQIENNDKSTVLFMWGTINIGEKSSDLFSKRSSNGGDLFDTFNDTKNLTNENVKAIKLYKFDCAEITNVHCGKNHCALVTKNGELYMMGEND